MENDKFYKKDQMAENVDRLMNDLTEFTTGRRERDAERLRIIRDNQTSGSSGEKNARGGLFSKFKRHNSKNDRDFSGWHDAVIYNTAQKPGISSEQPRDGYNEVFERDIEDDATVLIDEYTADGIDDDATVLMEDSAASEHLIVDLLIDGVPAAYDLTNGTVKIGSSRSDSDLVLSSRHVSRSHAILGLGFVIDTDSKNGTYINGDSKRIMPNTRYTVNPGDRIVFADTEVVIKDFRREYGTI